MKLRLYRNQSLVLDLTRKQRNLVRGRLAKAGSRLQQAAAKMDLAKRDIKASVKVVERTDPATAGRLEAFFDATGTEAGRVETLRDKLIELRKEEGIF